MKPTTAVVLLTLTALSPCVNAAEAVFTNGMDAARHRPGMMITFPDASRTTQRDRQPPGVPVPYPNSSMAGGMDQGRISGRDIVIRSTRYGRDRVEEACDTPLSRDARPGRTHFEYYSFDVKIEGAAVARHLEFMTHNIPSNPPVE